MTQAQKDIHDIIHDFMDKMSDERWTSHTREHAQIAEALKQYKIESNEWRGSLSDMRSQFMVREAYESKHEQLLKSLDLLEKRVSFFEDREKGAVGALSGTRALVLTSAAMITVVITVVVFFANQ